MHVLLHMCMFQNIPLVSWWSDEEYKYTYCSNKAKTYFIKKIQFSNILHVVSYAQCFLLLNIIQVPTTGFSSHTSSKSWSTAITALSPFMD